MTAELFRIRIGIVDDHTLFRKGCAALLNEFPDLEIVFQASDGEDMKREITLKPLPQVVLMDINMPRTDGYAATTWLKAHYPEIKVLALSMLDDDVAVIKMVKCGACGYILKEAGPRELYEAILFVNTKGIYVNEMLTGKLYRSIANETLIPKLSPRESSFLTLCCSEFTYKEIADQMIVSARTVDNYREALFEKLGIKSRTGLVIYAIKHGYYQV